MLDDLIMRLRNRARFMETRVDYGLYHEAAGALEECAGEVDGAAVRAFCAEHDISLLPWQEKKLSEL